MHESPLRHAFAHPGVYNVRVVDEEMQGDNSAFCNVVVEDALEHISFCFRPDLRFFAKNDVINATLSVGKGEKSNF